MRTLCGYVGGVVAFGSLALLAGCGGHYLFAEREPWRHDAEVACINSGAVKEGAGKVRISPIEGPGVCGIDLPLKVSGLGGENVPLGYDDELRPPGAIPNAANSSQPPWPIAKTVTPVTPPRPAGSSVTQANAPPPPPASTARPSSNAPNTQPLSLDPPATQSAGGAAADYDFRRPYRAARAPASRANAALASASASPSSYNPSPVPYDRSAVTQSVKPLPRASAPSPFTYGPAPTPVTAAPGPVEVSPPATLACPIVSALDQWIDEAVQPAALKWIGQPVIEIKQISAYSCRGMNGDPNATISEHAFGNALDIAAFTFADGRKIDVQHGWHGTPEEQAFLHEVQASACNEFTTVLAPGYNIYHYNHIHVDLMRRRSGHRACQPVAQSGDEVAARLGAHVAARRAEPAATGSVSRQGASTPAPRARPTAYTERKDRNLPVAVPGADGEGED